MGWFSPVKGSYPSLAQVDKTLPIAAGSAKIERGTIIALTVDSTGKFKDTGVFKVATSNDKILYVALQDDTDPTAGFAGTSFDPNGGVPAITGIDLGQDGEYETSVFADGDYTIGQSLYVNNGVLTGTGSGTVVGYVTGVPSYRWINDAVAVPDKAGSTDPRLAKRTGASKRVLRFKTA
jgi:hypothetical protein